MKILYPIFYRHVRNYRLIEPEETVILGLSGGKDSVSLFFLLRELQKDMDFKLTAAYFNHKLRTDQSDEEKWVQRFCGTHGVKLVVGSKNLPKFKEKHKLNLEHAASISRYRFFQEVSASLSDEPSVGKTGTVKVATAHTKSDLTETFFIKLFRGSGLQGLSTIYHKKENTIIRPLLLFSQEDILSFLERNKIKYYEDYTNREEVFMRNRIRHRVVPGILEIEPDIHNRIFKTVNIIQEEYDYFSRNALDILGKQLILDKILPASALAGHHTAIQRHVIREFLRKLKGNLLNIDYHHIEAIRAHYAEPGGIAVPGVELKFHKGFIYPHGFTIPGFDYPVNRLDRKKKRSSFSVPETGQRLIMEKIDRFKVPCDNHEIVVNSSDLIFPLRIRNAKIQDKYAKINTTINQKVFEMIRSSGMPSELRNLCPVLENGDGRIIWANGSPIADAFKTTEALKAGSEFLRIQIKKA